MEQLRDEELANIAHDYYLSRLTIGEIVKKYNLSRYLISRALDEAQQKGIVKISIKRKIKRNAKLEAQIKNKFDLKEVIVLKTRETTNQDNEALVSYAAEQVQAYLNTAQNAGVTWGTLVHDVINNFEEDKRENLTFVQLVGQPINSIARKNPLVQVAAAKYDANFRLLPAPLYAVHPELLTAIKNEPFYQTINDYYNNLDLIFSGIGTLASFSVSTYTKENYEKVLFKNIPEDKVAGMIFGRAYDINGRLLGDIDNHICGISIEQIMQTPVRFVIVKNRFKTSALLGALRAGFVTHLITNEGIANRVLKMA
ncbi:DNA-binding transcriptional regulator LsrR (DeoR family) [Lactobacillus colini]|uniref:DNA-binding transcriptional regulator LsrR (DeoR family) n=1 Tax=Lactobacillus colini TaxID=1819254 RepID=A0ABS4MDC6_9LACO|nr:sugar-binding domain-containing protein [Lactobacillus colini]MBP2057685.1 DNA-binding transcriptional regulator LsrR (DeoR family) [Lactobacillus colini]